MNVYYKNNAIKTLNAKMAFIKGRGSQITSENIAKVVMEGNTRDRAEGKDRYGKPIAPLRAPRTGAYKGKTGPPLAPSGSASRVVTKFLAKARKRGGNWGIVAGWVGVVSSKGYPFLIAHNDGTGRLPKRPIFGISPRTWSQIRGVISKFKQSVKMVRA